MIRTRFAPSPSGYLHVGGGRTALFAYLFARHHGGQFILRIEDTDVERLAPQALQAIIDGMHWLGLDYDNGPIYQSQRLDRYQEVIAQMLAQGLAYRCYCSKQRLQQLRAQQIARKQKPRYDGRCRELKSPPLDKFVIRFNNPNTDCVTFDDLVLGKIVINNSELDDVIIVRSDGMPTYNLAVVVDDIDMAITHVIRGMDHVNNTPRQLNLFYALGAKPPVYGHVPMIHGDDGKKLSKRHGAMDIMQYRDEGFLPQALRNYLVRLGWSHGNQEIFSKEEMIAYFDMTSISKSSAIFNIKKLLWLNQHYIKTLSPAKLCLPLQQQLLRLNIQPNAEVPLVDLILAQVARSKTLKEMAEKSCYFYQDVINYDDKAAKKYLRPQVAIILQTLIRALQQLQSWQQGAIHDVINTSAESLQLKLGEVAQPIRVAITGSTISPAIDVTIALLGREKTLQRLQQALNYCQALASH